MHRTGTRDQWCAEREALLAREKELTRLGDEVARERQAPLDRAPKGRNEDGYWHRRHDEYEAVTA